MWLVFLHIPSSRQDFSIPPAWLAQIQVGPKKLAHILHHLIGLFLANLDHLNLFVTDI